MAVRDIRNHINASVMDLYNRIIRYMYQYIDTIQLFYLLKQVSKGSNAYLILTHLKPAASSSDDSYYQSKLAELQHVLGTSQEQTKDTTDTKKKWLLAVQSSQENLA